MLNLSSTNEELERLGRDLIGACLGLRQFLKVNEKDQDPCADHVAYGYRAGIIGVMTIIENTIVRHFFNGEEEKYLEALAESVEHREKYVWTSCKDLRDFSK